MNFGEVTVQLVIIFLQQHDTHSGHDTGQFCYPSELFWIWLKVKYRHSITWILKEKRKCNICRNYLEVLNDVIMDKSHGSTRYWCPISPCRSPGSFWRSPGRTCLSRAWADAARSQTEAWTWVPYRYTPSRLHPQRNPRHEGLTGVWSVALQLDQSRDTPSRSWGT